ncbi:fasciclin domain-containing protein [Chitinophaga pendula]|uniref:fasciclin domain-containing protein n=1 Tax=Chitinophaga TaxID=79328 RepID=UPI000BB08358|nr:MULTISPECIES: fasciclin domain-containing protein [Chitinophaga]ASZ12025.1 hypothetical protein CK934_14175 [Chitinophaga sp. MD30]UCJ04942.1 fasciclin domain-containing protein [Chitinophaga pendula]
MKHYLLHIVITLAFVSIVACKKGDYLSGGNLANPKVEMTTYDYLKRNPLFDTLVLLVDRAGMKEQLNSNITFFAPTDYSIRLLMLTRTAEIQKKYNNENIKYTVDSFPVPELRDSIKAYMFGQPIRREQLSLSHQVFKNLLGQEYSVKLVESDEYDGILSQRPRFVHIIRIIKGLDPEPLPKDYPDTLKDKNEQTQTSGIITQTGTLHVINNQHTFYWR